MKKKIKNALVGYTGFIGSNLIHIKKNFQYFNSKNIHKIRNKSQEQVYQNVLHIFHFKLYLQSICVFLNHRKVIAFTPKLQC